MIIKIKARIWDGKICSFDVIDIDGATDVFLNMLKGGYFLIDKVEDDETNGSIILNKCIGMFLVNTYVVDNGDYDYEENYEPYYQEESEQIQIFYCPFTGDKIDFEILEEIDISDDLNNLIKRSKELSKYKAKTKQEEYRQTIKKINEYMQNNLFFFVNK